MDAMDGVARVAVLLALLGIAVAIGGWRRWADGRARAVVDGERITASELGGPLGARATIVQFSAPVCAPCRAARRLLTELTAAVRDVVHVELDAGEHLDLARRLGVLRTPTVMVLDARGQVVARTSGVPTRPQVVEALALAGAHPDPA